MQTFFNIQNFFNNTYLEAISFPFSFFKTQLGTFANIFNLSIMALKLTFSTLVSLMTFAIYNK